MSDYILNPIGYVRNGIMNRSDMTAYGVRSIIEILPEFATALDGIEENSHLIISAFFTSQNGMCSESTQENSAFIR